MSAPVGEIGLELNVNLAKFKAQMRNARRQISKEGGALTGSFGKIGKTIAAALSVAAITKFAKSCLDLGSDLAEVQNVVDVTFGDMSGRVNDFAKTAITQFGLSEKVAKDYMGTFGAMSKSFGNNTAAAYDQAEALTALSADVASFYNLSTDEAFTKLKSVFTGETESLKSLGVVMTQTALDQFAMQKGYKKTTKSMNEQEKVALRLAFVQDKLAGASGDFARTADGWANQTRVLSLRFDALKASIGQGLINALTPAVKMLNELLAKLQTAADVFRDFTTSLFGDAGSSTLAATSDTFADNLSDGAASAAAIKKTLAGFDELNVLSSGSTSGSSSSASSGTDLPSGAFGSAVSGPGFDKSEILATIEDISQTVGAATLALGAILTFTGANIPLGIGLMALGAVGLATAIAIDSSQLDGEIRGAMDLIAVTVGIASLALGAILALSGANIPLGIALMAIGAVDLAAEAAINWDSAYNEVSEQIALIEGAVGGATLMLGAFLTLSGTNIPVGIALLAAGAISLVSAAKITWGDPNGEVERSINALDIAVGGAALALGAILTFSGASIPLGIALMASGAINLVSAIAPMWGGVSDETKRQIDGISAVVGVSLLAIGAILLFTGAGTALGLGMLAAGGVALVNPIKSNWNWIVDGIKGVLNKIIGFFEGFINKIIGGINWLIDQINKVGFDVPDWVPGIGGKRFGFDLPHVEEKHWPRLATGGYVAANTPRLAVIGDNKHEGEIVAPESKIAEAVAVGFAKVLSQMRQSQSGSTPNRQPIVIKIGEDDFWNGFIDYHNSVVRRTGESPLLV